MEKTSLNQTDLSLYNNSWYNPGPLWLRILWLLTGQQLVRSRFPFPSRLKSNILRIFGAKIGKEVVLKPSINIKYPWLLEIDDYTWIGEEVWIDNLAKVTIGKHCCLSQGSYILTGNHNFTKKTFDLIVKPVTLHDGVWIGAKSILAPGVICYSHAVLAANSFSSKNLDPYTIYQGNPAIKVKTRFIDR